jgi:hypothetical protein
VAGTSVPATFRFFALPVSLLLDANPLEDIRNTRKIREVIQRGRIVDRAGLRQRGIR